MKSMLLIFGVLILPCSSHAANQAPPDSLVLEFIYKVQNTVNAHQPDFLNETVNLDKLVDRSFAGLPVQESSKEEFKRGVKNGFDWGNQLVKAIQPEGHYTAMSYSVTADTVSALFRMVGNDGINYHEYAAIYTDRFEIFDIYVFLSGEYISETFRNIVEPILISDEGFVARLMELGSTVFGDRHQYLVDIKKIPLIKQEIAHGNYKKAHGIYLELGEKIKQQKSIQLMNLSAVTNISDSLIVTYTDVYQKSYPDDPSLGLVLIDNYIVKEQYDEALSCIDQLLESVGEDGYLEFLKSNIYSAMGDTNRYVSHARLAIKQEPWLSEPYFTLIEYMLTIKNFSEVRSLMEALMENTELYFDEESMRGDAIFKEFLQSKEYREMKKN